MVQPEIGGLVRHPTADGKINQPIVWPIHLLRELRSDHAGETGAVFIYRGIVAVANLRGDADLITFAQRHRETESEHLRLIEDWLPPKLRSRLLGPWRIAGWLTKTAFFERLEEFTPFKPIAS